MASQNDKAVPDQKNAGSGSETRQLIKRSDYFGTMRPGASVVMHADPSLNGYIADVIETRHGTKMHVVFTGNGSSIVDPDKLRLIMTSAEPESTVEREYTEVAGWETVEYTPSDSCTRSLAYIFFGPLLSRQTAGGKEYKRSWNFINILLVCVPLSFWAAYGQKGETLTFILSFCAIIPLAGLLGLFTEDLSVHFGSAIGALLNASFGNATELIICILAVKEGLFNVIKNSLLGSVISNMLLVLGCAFLARSMRNGTDVRLKEIQKGSLWTFNPESANIFATVLLLSTFSLVIPTAFANLLTGPLANDDNTVEVELFGVSRGTALILLPCYCAFLTFQVRNAALFADVVPSDGGTQDSDGEGEGAHFSVGKNIWGLGVITVLIAFTSEFLVGSLESATRNMHLNEAWVAVILIPIVGNAAEHVTAVVAAYNGKGGRGDMECAVGVALGSSVQIAGFAVPSLVILSWIINGSDPPPIERNDELHLGGLDMNFHPFAMTLMTLSVCVVNHIVVDGEGSWLEGVTLIASYAVVAIVYWFVPMEAVD